MPTRPSRLQRDLLTRMRDTNTRIALHISNQRNYRASLDDPKLPTYARSVPMSTLASMRFRCWVELESERRDMSGIVKHFRLSAIGRQVLEQTS
jgi:hypothetical protein